MFPCESACWRLLHSQQVFANGEPAWLVRIAGCQIQASSCLDTGDVCATFGWPPVCVISFSQWFKADLSTFWFSLFGPCLVEVPKS